MRRVLSLYALMAPPSPRPAEQVLLDEQAQSTLRLIGLILLVQPLAAILSVVVAVSAFGVWRRFSPPAGFQVQIIAFPLLFLVGLLLIVAARHPRARRWARLALVLGVLALAPVIAFGETPFRVDGGPSILPLPILLGCVVMPFRPLEALALCLAVISVFAAWTLYGPLSLPLVASARIEVVRSSLPIWSALVVTVVVVGAVSWATRIANVRARVERDALGDRSEAQARALARANRELLEAQNELVRRRHLAVLGQLVAGVAHDLNNPTGALRGATDVLDRGLSVLERELPEPSARARKAFGALRGAQTSASDASFRIARVVRSLRLFARLDEAEEQRVDLTECLETALERLGSRLDGMTVTRDLAPLPPVRCRPAQMNEVFLELLGNAVEASGRSGEIRVAARAEPNAVVMAISDSGPGIPPEQRELIFEPGYTTKGRGIGTGLGLSSALRIVEEHAGRIEVEGEEGGATFSVRLPLQPGAS